MSQHLPKAMLLDLDDTIISFSAHADACWRAASERFAAQVNGSVSPETLYTTIQESRRWFWSDPQRHLANRQHMRRAQRLVVAEALRRLGADDMDLATQIADTFTDSREEAVKPFPGAIDTLKRLREHGVRLALITNGAAEPQRAKIDRFDLAPYFHAILIEGECGYGKPDERIYCRALDLLDASSADAWMVGDNPEWEVAVPQRLGIYAVWHDPTGKGEAERGICPDRIICSLKELIQDTDN